MYETTMQPNPTEGKGRWGLPHICTPCPIMPGYLFFIKVNISYAVTYNSRSRQFIILDSKGITAWSHNSVINAGTQIIPNLESKQVVRQPNLLKGPFSFVCSYTIVRLSFVSIQFDPAAVAF
jgi:hypothetical protein